LGYNIVLKHIYNTTKGLTIKLILKLFILLLLSVSLIFLYWWRNQTIDFSKKMPTQLIHNSTIINSSSNDYIKIKKLLAKYKDNWRNTLASYVPKDTYSNVAKDSYFNINISEKAIIINYKDENNKLHQLIRDIP